MNDNRLPEEFLAKQQERKRKVDAITVKFEKAAAEMPCWLDASEEAEIGEADRETCYCPGCKFRRRMARLRESHGGNQERKNGIETLPKISDMKDAFSEFLTVFERIEKDDSYGDLRLMKQVILAEISEMKAGAENTERLRNRLIATRAGFMGTVSSSSAQFAPRIQVGTQVRVGMTGTVESMDGDSMLVRYERMRLP
jgi:hypothetical protein